MSKPSSPHCRRRTSRRQTGQSLTEYAIIVFLIAVGTIGIVGLFGDNVRHLFGSSAEALAGNADVKNNGSENTSKLTKWSMKGVSSRATLGGGPGGVTPGASMPPPGPGGTSGKFPGGGPGGVTNSVKPGPGGSLNNVGSVE